MNYSVDINGRSYYFETLTDAHCFSRWFISIGRKTGGNWALHGHELEVLVGDEGKEFTQISQ
jgi:hypothetical protein